MLYISSKEIEELDENTLRKFLQKQYRENRFLDYKLKYHKRTEDEAREELLADITGFANYYGGNIIIGVEELREEGQNSLPGNLVGIEEGSRLAEAYRNLCDTSIDPPVAGLVIKEILLQNGKWAIIVYVPVSLRRPHMITFRGKNRFYIRHDDRTVKMTTDEVKRTVIEVLDMERSIESYARRAEQELIEDFLGSDFSLILQVIPFLLEEDQIDTSKKEIRDCLNDQNVTGPDLRIWHTIPSLHGVCSCGTKSYYQIHIHRTGYMGLAINLKDFLKERGEKVKMLAPWIERYFQNFLNISKQIANHGNISSPYQIQCKFLNANSAIYKYNEQGFIEQAQVVWKRNTISLPSLRVDNFENNMVTVYKLLFERLRNSFGLQ